MRHLLAAAFSLAASAALAQPAPWQPRPVQGATEPSEVVASSTAEDWRPIDPENLLVMDLADGGRVIIELAPAFAASAKRADPCRQCPPLRPRRLVGRSDGLPGPGQLCRAMGKQRVGAADAAGRHPPAAGRI